MSVELEGNELLLVTQILRDGTPSPIPLLTTTGAIAALAGPPDVFTLVFETWMASLPTTPGAPGTAFNDNGVPAISQEE